jgi:hypothetical protein
LQWWEGSLGSAVHPRSRRRTLLCTEPCSVLSNTVPDSVSTHNMFPWSNILEDAMPRFSLEDLPHGHRKSPERDGRRFAERLHAIRTEDLQATVAEFAEYAALSESAVAAVERAREVPTPPTARTPSPPVVARILIACGVEASSACIAAEATSTPAAAPPLRQSALVLPVLPALLSVLPAVAIGALAAAAWTGQKRLGEDRGKRRQAASLPTAALDARPHPRAPNPPYSLYALPPREELVTELEALVHRVPVVVLAAVVDQLRTVAAQVEEVL